MLSIFILLQSLFIFNNPVEWQTNLESAQKIASDQNKEILVVFAGSDWCIPCMKFKETILLAEDFKSFEKDNLVVVYLDFPAKKKNKLPAEQTAYNEKLASKYNPSGLFPHIVLLDSQGAVIKHLKFDNQTPKAFTKEIKSLI